jgi:2-amino-4-hydroxy-6-hydroxymethyldihydropteridine diphosphokinase
MHGITNVAIATKERTYARTVLAAWGGDPMLIKNVFLGLGSNLGDRNGNLNDAIAALVSCDSINVTAQSSILETEPVGNENQGKFLNAVIEIETTLSPKQLMQTCLEIEMQQGRVRDEKWGPRTIDIDILFFADQLIQEDGLEVPHPEAQNRSFVLIPLVEIAPMMVHPTLGVTAKAMLHAL